MSALLDAFSGMLWTYLAIPLLLFSGAYLSFKCRLVQLRMIPEMFRVLTARNHGDEKSISSFKAFTISAASRVGTGNIAGVATAIALGGPGAVFWMWVVAMLGGATAFVESTLGQLYKSDKEYRYHGGPAYYIQRALGWRWLAVLFAVMISITYGLVFNSVQANSIVDAMQTSFGGEGGSQTLAWGIGVVLTLLTGVIIFGGVQTISKVSVTVVPVMAVLYLGIGTLVIILNIGRVPAMFGEIFAHAFGIREIAGGGIGAAIMMGMRRGLFSNEAGMGSVPNASATASVSHPVKQGLVQTLGVYFDTMVICTMTAIIILLADPSHAYGDGAMGASLTQWALAEELGNWAIHFLTFAILLFAFTSVVGNYYYGESNIQYMFGGKLWLQLFRVLVLAFVMIGSVVKVSVVWSMADVFMPLLALTNLIAILPLAGIVARLLKHYRAQRAQGVEPVFHRDDMPDLKNIECWDGSDPTTRAETYSAAATQALKN
ncbi:alanine:cation symporter family protein [Pseudomonas seleniipraecipitans]|uniref:Alanine:cation symporter family protein n=1 Tax=Phytopseudomonas seleniipraecipitans TaxID=640205 RepID=A0ABY5J6N2_9GAMM|nr:alanine/glycine:cation symporter family protein [Pseudomonas seleniipraecipitans]UUD63734.1 alanine:cation symporter family protein [Pseudomonas seleniipraecipitans]